MGSHGVTCHPTKVNAACHNSSQSGQYSIYLLRRDGNLSWSTLLFVMYQDGFPLQRQSFVDVPTTW